MKIWIDLTNSPHINFFEPFKKIWEKQGHELIITTRDLSNTIDLVNQKKWKHTLISGHAGKSRFLKGIYFLMRVFRLWFFLKNQKIDVGISHSSFYAPLVGKMIGCKTIYLNDNEHAKGNYLAFPFATISLLPEFLIDKFKNNIFAKIFNIKFYKGVKEGVYLSQNTPSIKENFNPKEKANIYVRLEPDTADYYSGNTKFLDDLLIALSVNENVVILPRNKRQKLRFENQIFKDIKVVESTISFQEICSNCDLFIGAGGSMTRELALLNITTLSIYQGKLLEVDKYLVANNFMHHISNPTLEEVLLIIKNKQANINKKLLKKGCEAFNLIMQTVDELGNEERNYDN